MVGKINNNGFDFVDLGLPSGTLWSTCNIGASKPTDYGLYFQWGDTIGYTADQVGTKKKFSMDWSDYKWGVAPNFTKYNTNGAKLDLEDDAANFNMGGDWHIPTPEQCQELIDNTTSEWTTLDDVNGRLFTSKKDSSKSIFIPATDIALEGSINGNGDGGLIWSSMLSTFSVFGGRSLYFDSGGASLGNDSRCLWRSVRGVIG